MDIRDHHDETRRPDGKERFDDIYDQLDPRPYFRRLGALEYQIPHHGQRVFRELARNRRSALGGRRPIKTVDLCCSYGINAALLNHDLTYADLGDHYTSPAVARLTSDELAALDRDYYAGRRRASAARVVGIDSSANAIGYGVRSGLLADGFAENLEDSRPSPALRAAVADADLVTVTGGIGYITEKTVQHVLDSIPTTPWVAAFVLRTIPYEGIAGMLSGFGLVTEKLPGRTFPQRRFSGTAEERFALDELERLGVDAADRESRGYYHTELFVSRPVREAAEVPVERLFSFGADAPTPG